MQDDFRDDADYKKVKGGMFGSHVKSILWGAVATVATVTAITATGWAIAAAAAVALVAGALTWSARKDENAGLAEVAARRTAHHIAKAMQEERAATLNPGVSQDTAVTSGKWQQTEDAKAATATAHATVRC